MNSSEPRQTPPTHHHTFPQLERLESIKAQASEWKQGLRRVRSELGSRGRRLRMSTADSDKPSAIEAAVSSANKVAQYVPLYASLYPRLEQTKRSSSHSRWIDILPVSSPTDYSSNQRSGDDSECTTTPKPSSGSHPILLAPPAPTVPSRPSSRNSNLPPIKIPERTEFSHIQAVNPDHTEFIDPGTTLSDSPQAQLAVTEIYRQSLSCDGQQQGLHDIFTAFSGLDDMSYGGPPPAIHQTQDSGLSYTTAKQLAPRKMLIIGSSYSKRTDQMSTRISIISSMCSLHATGHDVKSLASAFRRQGYSVDTMVDRPNIDKNNLLCEVGNFLELALPGDVRALVFTGHSIREDDGSTSMVLPGIPCCVRISAEEWNNNIREHAKPGVIVLSVISSCYSGAFVEQPVRIANFTDPEQVADAAAGNAPILITFSSCGPRERGFESSVGHHTTPRDHFLWALTAVARDPRLQTWSEFMTMLQEYFAYARATAANLTYEGAVEWLYRYRQTPMVTAPSSVPFPTLEAVFPRKLDSVCNACVDFVPPNPPHETRLPSNNPTIVPKSSRPRTSGVAWHSILGAPDQSLSTPIRQSDSPRLLQTTPRRIPPPITVPAPVAHIQIQAYNPHQTQIIHPGSLLVSSPTALTPNTGGRFPGGYTVLEPLSVGEIAEGVASLDFLSAFFAPTSREQTYSTIDTWTTARQIVERKMLIIGSSYNTPARRATEVNIISPLYGSLYGVKNDVRELRSAFQTRGYSIQTMTSQEFDREDVLTEIAEFLAPALPGDIRAIVFSGHAEMNPDLATPNIVLPAGPDSFISADDWTQVIRTHAKPGVVVLSIFATCHSGGFAEQDACITDLSLSGSTDTPSWSSPIHITFSSSRSTEQTFESPLGYGHTQSHDHFLWALAQTAREPQVRNWKDFADLLTEYFFYARVRGVETMGTNEGLRWLRDHPQHPELVIEDRGNVPVSALWNCLKYHSSTTNL
ncbi:ICE-like protease (caspase) p20 domain protein [Ceratobasidium sp. AG-Ba]|nr:ICE-like protease (caspase) p20 domain protein [Ceratobasidium sp. AG-Ba]